MSFALVVAILLSKLAQLVLMQKIPKVQCCIFENANFHTFACSFDILYDFTEYINTDLQFPLMLMITFWASTTDEARARTSNKPA